jgi:hypothetical protein
MFDTRTTDQFNKVNKFQNKGVPFGLSHKLPILKHLSTKMKFLWAEIAYKISLNRSTYVQVQSTLDRKQTGRFSAKK